VKVFVTGATGYIGSAVVDALVASGHTVVGLARSEEAAAKLLAAGAEVVRSQLNDPNAVREASADSDGVIHTANTNDTNAARADEAAVTSIIAGLRTTKRPFVYTSGIWVNGNTGGAVIDENAPYHPFPLVAWRPAHEQTVLEAEKERVRGIVIRPGIVYGRGGGIPAMMLHWAKQRGAFPVVGDGENYWPMVHVDDLARLYVLALDKAPARTILCGASGEAVKVRDIVAAAGGKVEPWPLEQARKEIGGFADGLAADQKVSGARAMELLGWKPSQPSVLEDVNSGSYAKLR
jgi:nucleoside-diphosphate-sugar epimerase